MLELVDAYVVFSDCEAEKLVGSFDVNKTKKEGVGSQKELADIISEVFEEQGKKIIRLSIRPSKGLAA